MTHLLSTTVVALTVLAGSAFAQEVAKPANKQDAGIAFFEKKIRPVLVTKCYKCHSKDSEKAEGGLLLDTKAGIDYLYIDSVPPYRVVRGDRLTYKMHAQSRSKRVRYELTDGPEGMSVNAKGQLRWDVPKNFDADSVTVITRVAAGEEEAFHSFDLAIEKAPAPMKATGKAKKNKQN